jgi:hypothetical protein
LAILPARRTDGKEEHDDDRLLDQGEALARFVRPPCGGTVARFSATATWPGLQYAGQAAVGVGYWRDAKRRPTRTRRRIEAQAALVAVQHAGVAGGGHAIGSDPDLNELERLDLTGTPVTAAAVAELRAALPHCQIDE